MLVDKMKNQDIKSPLPFPEIFIPKDKPRVTWKMETFLEESLSNTLLYQAPQMVCNLVKEMTDGDFIIDLIRSGNTEEILEKVSEGRNSDNNSGGIDCGYSGIYYNQNRYRPLFFSSAIPFGLNPQEQNAWLLYKKNDGDLTYIQQVYQKIMPNILAFPAGGTGSQMGGWFKKEINSISDFDNKIMRIPGLGADVLAEFGVKSYKKIWGKPLKINQIKDELDKGNLDAAEWIGPYDDMQLGLHKIQGPKYYYYPGWWEPATTFDVQVNLTSWEKLEKLEKLDKLDNKYQSVLKSACWQTHLNILAMYEQKNSQAMATLEQLEKTGDFEIKPFKKEILEAAEEKTRYVLTQYSKNPDFEDVYTEWKNFKAQIQGWSKYTL